jgi:hypothetical protein
MTSAEIFVGTRHLGKRWLAVAVVASGLVTAVRAGVAYAQPDNGDECSASTQADSCSSPSQEPSGWPHFEGRDDLPRWATMCDKFSCQTNSRPTAIPPGSIVPPGVCPPGADCIPVR